MHILQVDMLGITIIYTPPAMTILHPYSMHLSEKLQLTLCEVTAVATQFRPEVRGLKNEYFSGHTKTG